MKLVILIGLLAIITVVGYVGINFNQQYIKKSYALELCRDSQMANYEMKWNEDCYKHWDVNPNFSCEQGWNTYTAQMNSCGN